MRGRMGGWSVIAVTVLGDSAFRGLLSPLLVV